VKASEDFQATTHGGPVTLPLPPGKVKPRKGESLNAKNRLRSEMRALRRDHVAALPDRMRALMFLRPPSPVAALAPEEAIVGLYCAHGAEAPTASYARWFHENGRRIALPWYADRDAPLRFRLWEDPYHEDGLEPGPFRFGQPVASAPEVTPDVVMVPLIAFTADGHRLGQGGGHYDRWLEAHPDAMAVGMAWDCQLVDTLPIEPHDRILRAVVTPTRLYEGET